MKYIQIVTALLAVFFLTTLIACSPDIEEVTSIANIVSAFPPGYPCRPANETITVTFDNPPRDVTVSAGTVSVSGNTATITGPFPPKMSVLTITWTDGTQALNYQALTSPAICTGLL